MINGPISVGDVVQLKSGGAPMTVESFEPGAPTPAGNHHGSADKMVRCIWHGADGSTQERNFWPHTLVLDAKFAEAKKAEQAAAEQRAAELGREAEAKRLTDERAADVEADHVRQLQDA